MKLLFSAFLVSALWLPPGEVRSVELPEVIQVQIQALSAEGDRFAEDGPYREALEKFLAAFALLPDPPPPMARLHPPLSGCRGCELSGWGLRNWPKERCPMSCTVPMRAITLSCTCGLGRHYSNLEKENPRPRAWCMLIGALAARFLRADDPKYFEFLKTVMKPPAGGTW